MKTDKAREFYVAETLKGDLHIFRENHQGGGLTKFVEYTAYEQLEQRNKWLEERFDHVFVGELEQRVKELEVDGEFDKTALKRLKELWEEQKNELKDKLAAQEREIEAASLLLRDIYSEVGGIEGKGTLQAADIRQRIDRHFEQLTKESK